MLLLILGLLLFLGVHSISIINEPFRDQVAKRLGVMPWKAVYSCVAGLGFVLILIGYGQARLDPIVLYTPPIWTRHLTMLLLVPVFILLLAAYLPGRIKQATKHPMLAATKLWALAHLFANGTLADVLLFGSFLAWAVADRISIKRRRPHPTPIAHTGPRNDMIAVGGGLALYVAFVILLHRVLIGVSPIG
ncbi:MAG: NnrU family protein [Hahellaceae bacterium]|nr:NnrU family protein [Hahellaceae bacterium]